jgi:hypothetical protein
MLCRFVSGEMQLTRAAETGKKMHDGGGFLDDLQRIGIAGLYESTLLRRSSAVLGYPEYTLIY